MRLKKVFEKDSYEYYEYSPTLLKPFYINLEKLTVKRKIRLAIALFGGYLIYYLVKDGRYVGYCLVQSGKDRRYKFATKKDIIVGPYYIINEYRGKRLSIELLNYVLKHSGLEFENAYDYIKKDNIPSIKASESVGFSYMCDAKISRWLRKIHLLQDDKGDYIILQYKNIKSNYKSNNR